MRAIDGTPVDKIEQRFNVFSTEIKSINEKTQTDRKTIEEVKQQSTNLARSLSESIDKFNRDIAQTETSLSQNIQQKTTSLSESIKSVSDNLTTTQKELTELIEKLNKGTTEITPEQLGARLALLEEWQVKIDQWKKLLIDEDTDNVVNTLTEIFAKFKDMPEDVGTILEQLGKKVNKEDVYSKNEADNFLKNKIEKVRRINDGTDFNNIKETGFYYCDYDVTFNTLINRPLTNSGFLKVTGDNLNWVLQEWTMYNDPKRTFVRRLYAGSWTGWQEVGGLDLIVAVVVNFTSGAITVTHYYGSGISVSRPRSANFRFFHNGVACSFANGYFVSLNGFNNTFSAYSSLMWGLGNADGWSAPVDGSAFYANMNDFSLSFLIFKK